MLWFVHIVDIRFYSNAILKALLLSLHELKKKDWNEKRKTNSTVDKKIKRDIAPFGAEVDASRRYRCHG